MSTAAVAVCVLFLMLCHNVFALFSLKDKKKITATRECYRSGQIRFFESNLVDFGVRIVSSLHLHCQIPDLLCEV